MKWMPKWIGKCYAKLWIQFGEESFSYYQAKQLLKKYTSNYLSELKKSQSLITFGNKRHTKRYRLIPPNIFIYAYGNNISLDWLKKSIYTGLLLKFFWVMKEYLKNDLLAVGIFGSLARGTATNESDIDVFIIVKNLNMSLFERTKYFIKLKKDPIVSKEINFLRSQNYNPQLNCYIRQPEELKINYFTIDLSYDMKYMFDSGFLEKFLNKIEEKIKKKGIKRLFLDEEKYYLDLGLNFGEVYEF